MADATEYDSIEALVKGARERCLHVECGPELTQRAVRALREAYAGRRLAFYLETDKGYERESVRSYLRFFSRIAGGGASVEGAISHFGLSACARTTVSKLTAEQVRLMNYARLSLFEPEACLVERPLAGLGAEARAAVLTWMGERAEAGCVLVTVGESLREALLLPGEAWYEEDGRLFAAEVDPGGDAPDEGPAFDGDEVRVCKIAAKSGTTTLLFDPREIDFVESLNRANHVSVRGELYPTSLGMDELEAELSHFGFFRCHRSYIVNVQKVKRVERFTRNSFTLVLSDAAHSSVPLAKGRAEEMRERYGWR